MKKLPTVRWDDELHLGVSMRSYRAEHLSLLVKQLLDLDEGAGGETFAEIDRRYPLVLTRSLNSAKDWLKNQARGSEPLWNRRVIAGAATQAACDRRTLTHGPDPLVS